MTLPINNQQLSHKQAGLSIEETKEFVRMSSDSVIDSTGTAVKVAAPIFAQVFTEVALAKISGQVTKLPLPPQVQEAVQTSLAAAKVTAGTYLNEQCAPATDRCVDEAIPDIKKAINNCTDASIETTATAYMATCDGASKLC